MSQERPEDNPYQVAIRQIGIGAFALLPSKDESGSRWLTDFLKEKLGQPGCEQQYPTIGSGHFYLEEPSRIATLGMQQVRHTDLTLIIPTADQDGSSLFTSISLRKVHAGITPLQRPYLTAMTISS